MKKYIGATLLAVSVLTGTLLFSADAHAMVVRWGESLTFEPYTTTDDDLYVLGKEVSMQGTTTGDVLAVGRSIGQGGVVEGDGLYLGSLIKLDGTIKGDVRGAGGNLHVTGTIDEDFLFAGGMVTIDKDAVINGDVFVLGDLIIIEGTVHGAVNAYVRAIQLEGQIDGPLDIKASETLSVVGDAHIMNDLMYSAPREAFISETATVEGEIHFSETEKSPEHQNPLVSMGTVVLVLMTVIAALAVLYFFPLETRDIARTALEGDATKKAFHIFYALVLLAAVPLLSLFLMLTFVGIIPALVLLFAYLTALGVAFSVAPVVASILLVRLLKKEEKAFETAWVSLAAVIFTLLALLPLLGWLVRFVIFLLTFYAVFVVLRKGLPRKQEQNEENVPQVTQSTEIKEDVHEKNNETNSTHGEETTT